MPQAERLRISDSYSLYREVRKGGTVGRISNGTCYAVTDQTGRLVAEVNFTNCEGVDYSQPGPALDLTVYRRPGDDPEQAFAISLEGRVRHYGIDDEAFILAAAGVHQPPRAGELEALREALNNL